METTYSFVHASSLACGAEGIICVVGQKSVDGQTKDVVPSDALDQIEFI